MVIHLFILSMLCLATSSGFTPSPLYVCVEGMVSTPAPLMTRWSSVIGNATTKAIGTNSNTTQQEAEAESRALHALSFHGRVYSDTIYIMSSHVMSYPLSSHRISPPSSSGIYHVLTETSIITKLMPLSRLPWYDTEQPTLPDIHSVPFQLVDPGDRQVSE